MPKFKQGDDVYVNIDVVELGEKCPKCGVRHLQNDVIIKKYFKAKIKNIIEFSCGTKFFIADTEYGEREFSEGQVFKTKEEAEVANPVEALKGAGKYFDGVDPVEYVKNLRGDG